MSVKEFDKLLDTLDEDDDSEIDSHQMENLAVKRNRL